ncbi:hypothetical protein EZS27_041249, partial [termite gut metagenome]
DFGPVYLAIFFPNIYLIVFIYKLNLLQPQLQGKINAIRQNNYHSNSDNFILYAFWEDDNHYVEAELRQQSLLLQYLHHESF